MPKVSAEHKQRRREEILEGAQRAFARHGYEGATVARLEVEWGRACDPQRLRDELRRNGADVVGLVHAETSTGVLNPIRELAAVAREHGAKVVSPTAMPDAILASPKARAVAKLEALLEARGPVDIASWEPSYGRLAEAQVRWESAHGTPLPVR